MAKYFKTDGYRGKVGKDLVIKHAYMIGEYLAWSKIKANGIAKPCRIIIGKDTRRSSYAIEYALSSGIASVGADAYLMHVTTTPSVAYAVKTGGFDYGIMISASHNPYYDNGIKIIGSGGEKVSENVTDEIEYYIDNGKSINGETPSLLTPDITGEIVDYSAVRSRYSAYLVSLFPYSLWGKKIVLDTANGSTYKIARSVYEALGAEVVVINSSPNGFNINENCGSTHIDGLRKEVINQRADVGFAFDGDGDRCIAVDEQGNVVDGDKIIYSSALFLKEKGELVNDRVALTLMSNLALIEELKANGITVDITAVGDRFVYEKMCETGSSLGGENSGHIIFSKHATTGDGILTSLKVLEMMFYKKLTLNELVAPLKLYPQVCKNLAIQNPSKAVLTKKVKDATILAEKFLGKCGRVVVRASGTEPVVRIMAEASEELDAITAVKMIEDAFKV